MSGTHLIQDTKTGDVFIARFADGECTSISDALHWSDWRDEDGTILLSKDDLMDCDLNIHDVVAPADFRVIR